MSFLSTDWELSTDTCSKNVYSIGPWLVGEVEDVRQVMESMKRIITGLGLEEKGEETGDRVAELGEAEKCEKVMIPDRRLPVAWVKYDI